MCFLVPWPQRKKVSSGTYQFLIYPGHISFPFMNWQLEDHTFREVIFDTRLCPTACRHGKRPKGVHVLYPCTIHIKAALPHISKLTLHDCQLGDFICWSRALWKNNAWQGGGGVEMSCEQCKIGTKILH